MTNAFFDRPILNSPYEHPSRHWELDHGQPTQQDWSDLVVHAPPLYIQEKVHPKVLIDDLKRYLPSLASGKGAGGECAQMDLFADFNGLPDDKAKTELYQHDAHWATHIFHNCKSVRSRMNS